MRVLLLESYFSYEGHLWEYLKVSVRKPVALKPFQKYFKIIIHSKCFPNCDLGP